jgi:probable F420-dependent oxidoreductase
MHPNPLTIAMATQKKRGKNMKIDAGFGQDLHSVAENAKWLEEVGYDGIISAETAHDPFLPLLLAAEHTNKVDLLTSIAVGFARNPMLLANLAHDLNAFSKGRFILGIGSQIRPHIQKRFSMPWSHPAARMREMIESVNAIWDCWYDGKELNYRGKFYTHTLMTPMFTPTDTEHGRPKIVLAAVGPKMTQTAAEVADGMIIHAFSTEKYIREVTLPTIEAGLKASGRKREDFTIIYPSFAVTADTEEGFNQVKTAVKKQIAFYGSTPAYKVVLDAHGWGDLQPELNRLSKIGRWDEMGELIEDPILDAFAVVGEPDQAIAAMKARFGDIIDRTTMAFQQVDRKKLPDLLQKMKAA